MKHRHRVIDDVRQQRVAIVAQQHTATDRSQAYLWAQLGVAQVSLDEIDRRRRGRAGAGVEHDLVADQQGTRLGDRQFDRPSLTIPVAEAQPPAGKAKIIAVEIHGREPLVASRDCDDPVAEPAQIGELELPARCSLRA